MSTPVCPNRYITSFLSTVAVLAKVSTRISRISSCVASRTVQFSTRVSYGSYTKCYTLLSIRTARKSTSFNEKCRETDLLHRVTQSTIPSSSLLLTIFSSLSKTRGNQPSAPSHSRHIARSRSNSDEPHPANQTAPNIEQHCSTRPYQNTPETYPPGNREQFIPRDNAARPPHNSSVIRWRCLRARAKFSPGTILCINRVRKDVYASCTSRTTNVRAAAGSPRVVYAPSTFPPRCHWG